jgi:two-component system sensor histidine kinase/response regulator
MNDFIAKPIDVAQLFQTLARWVKAKNPMVVEMPVVVEDDTLPAIPGLRMDAALSRVGGNTKLMRKLLARFVETQMEVMQRIENAIESNDLAAATREAHTVKGLAGNIGATAMADAAARVEQMLAQGETAGREEALTTMGVELNDLISRIALATSVGVTAAAALTAPAAAAEVDMAQLSAALGEVARLLAQDDGAAVKLVDGVCQQLQAAGQAEHGRNLRRLLGHYDFEGALDELKAAASALNISL